MRIFFVALALLATPALATEPALRPSARLLFKQPELLQTGSCVVYEEGGSGWVMTDPVYYLRGTVLSADVRTRHAAALPCVAADVPERDEQIGLVRLRVTAWETPHAIRAANAGRLYRGMFIDHKLEKDMEIELEADQLGVCAE